MLVYVGRSTWCSPSGPGGDSVDAECVRDALCERLNNARGVEDHSDRDCEDDELHESDDFTGEQEEERDDPDDAQEQRPEKPLQISHEARGAERPRGRDDERLERHRSTPGYVGLRLAWKARAAIGVLSRRPQWRGGGADVLDVPGAPALHDSKRIAHLEPRGRPSTVCATLNRDVPEHSSGDKPRRSPRWHADAGDGLEHHRPAQPGHRRTGGEKSAQRDLITTAVRLEERRKLIHQDG